MNIGSKLPTLKSKPALLTVRWIGRLGWGLPRDFWVCPASVRRATILSQSKTASVGGLFRGECDPGNLPIFAQLSVGPRKDLAMIRLLSILAFSALSILSGR